MKRIGILSDTHALWDDRFAQYFGKCDEIWHAGDIGSEELLDRLEGLATVRAVYGNIDGASLRRRLKEVECFTTEGVKVLMTHIGGYPGRYSQGIKATLVDLKTNDYAKNTSGNIIETTTNSNGEYKLSNVPQGEYIVIFEYDSSKYTLTQYQKDGVPGNKNSKVISRSKKITGNKRRTSSKSTSKK